MAISLSRPISIMVWPAGILRVTLLTHQRSSMRKRQPPSDVQEEGSAKRRAGGRAADPCAGCTQAPPQGARASDRNIFQNNGLRSLGRGFVNRRLRVESSGGCNRLKSINL